LQRLLQQQGRTEEALDLERQVGRLRQTAGAACGHSHAADAAGTVA
jgi:hypothetical protein